MAIARGEAGVLRAAAVAEEAAHLSSFPPRTWQQQQQVCLSRALCHCGLSMPRAQPFLTGMAKATFSLAAGRSHIYLFDISGLVFDGYL